MELSTLLLILLSTMLAGAFVAAVCEWVTAGAIDRRRKRMDAAIFISIFTKFSVYERCKINIPVNGSVYSE